MCRPEETRDNKENDQSFFLSNPSVFVTGVMLFMTDVYCCRWIHIFYFTVLWIRNKFILLTAAYS